MSTNPPPPIPPFIAHDDVDDASVPLREVDGEEQLDPDADADGIDSADADRLAAERGDARSEEP